MNLDRVWRGGLDYRLGLQFRPLSLGPPSRESFESSVTLRLQVASPPPKRLDGSNWFDGLRVSDGTEGGRPFDPSDDTWRELGVFAPRRADGGPENLKKPAPETLIFDGSIEIPLVKAPELRRTATTLLRSGEPVIGEADHFLSVYYPPRTYGGVVLTAAAVTYHIAGALPFSRDADGWIAVSLDQFAPDDRESADYIAPVDPE